jgi:hypothetical protein
VLNGQKIWTSRAHVARRCLVLARSGSAESRHRGLSMLWVDLESPGVTVKPLACADGRNAVSEVFFDDVVVPATELVGELDGGWAVALYLLQFERGNYAWQRQAWLGKRLQEAIANVEPGAGDGGDAETAGLVGDAYLDLFALRATSSATLPRLAAGESPGPAISVDKILLSTAEKSVLETARRLLWPAFETGGDDASAVWRREWWFSRVTSILGGAVEVQRDIVAGRILGLPRG